jgi:hypothetical protein
MLNCKDALKIAADEAIAKGDMVLHFRILRMIAKTDDAALVAFTQTFVPK